MTSLIKLKNIYKEYKTGSINYKTLQKDFQSFIYKFRGLEDPNSIISKNNNSLGSILALDDINLELYANCRLGLIGKNGSGKSTLLKLISRVTVPTLGSVEINGRVSSLLEVGVGFHPELTGRENIYLSGSIAGLKKENVKNYVEEIIDFSEVRKYIDTPIKRYSSGMLVKLGFSISTIFNNDILLVDEVLAVGDKNFREKALNKMLEIGKNKNKLIVFVSHNMELIKMFCNQCIVLSDGKVLFNGDTDSAINKYNNLN